MIKVIKHRVNDYITALEASEQGFGIECDVWNMGDVLLMTHDSPIFSEEYLEEHLIDVVDLDVPVIAINAKSTSLTDLGVVLFGKDNYFIFDAAVPEAIKLLKRGLKVYTRHSEYEPTPSFYKEATGVWMDMMNNDWVKHSDILRHLTNNKEVAITSPELHGRSHREFWQYLKGLDNTNDVYLCTKYPEEAERYFSLAV